MTRKKCLKQLMSVGLSKREANRMVNFLRDKSIPRCGVVFTVLCLTPGSYGREDDSKRVLVHGLSPEIKELINRVITEPQHI